MGALVNVAPVSTSISTGMECRVISGADSAADSCRIGLGRRWQGYGGCPAGSYEFHPFDW